MGIILGLVAFVGAQYSGETQDLSNSQLDALKDIFGDAAAGGAYSGQQVGRLEGGTNGVEAIIQVVKNEEGYVAPDDYQTTAGLTDKATTNVDNVFENCADYTATLGYECVPYYQCHNGTIITDNGDDSYNTNDKLIEVDDSYNTNEEIVDDSYNTNDKIVDVDDSYNTNEKIVEVDDSYNTNEKIVDQPTPVTCASPPAAKITKENDENYGDVFDLREDDKVGDGTKQY